MRTTVPREPHAPHPGRELPAQTALFTTPQQVTRILHQAQSLVGPALRAAVQSLPPAMRQIASYHLGWHAQPGHLAERTGGKAVRAALALTCCEAAGAPLHSTSWPPCPP